MKCDLCTARDAAQYDIEYGWLQKVESHLSHEKGTETTYRPIGLLSRKVCSDCASDCLRNDERWRRLGWWLGSIMSVLLFLLMLWVDGGPLAIPFLLVWIGFLFWSFWSMVTLAFRLIDRDTADAALKLAIESDIWRTNVDQLREDLHELEPHFIFHPTWDRSKRNIHSQLGLWHYCESGGPKYKYFVKPSDPIPGTDWIH